MNESTFNKIVDIISQHFMVPREAISAETTALDIDGWDSVSHTMLILEIEEQLGVSIPPEKIGKLKNVGDLVDAVDL